MIDFYSRGQVDVLVTKGGGWGRKAGNYWGGGGEASLHPEKRQD